MVLAIISIVMGVIFTNQNSFNKTLVLSNTAYDIALSLQSTEMLGVGGRGNAGYGVHFVNGNPTKSFSIFGDISSAVPLPAPCHSKDIPLSPNMHTGDCAYSESDTVTATYAIGNGFLIQDICASDSSGNSFCFSKGNLPSLDIVFSRPNPAPSMSINGVYNPSLSNACLKLISAQGGTDRYITVSIAGSINANATPCTP